MSRLFGAAVYVAVVLWQKVDIVEDVARVVGLFTRLSVTDVHQHRSVEPRRPSLGKTTQPASEKDALNLKSNVARLPLSWSRHSERVY